MQLSKPALREFKEIYRQIVGDDLVDVELLECAIGIIKLIQLLIRKHEKRKRNK